VAEAPRSLRSGRIARAGLCVVTLGFGFGLAAIPVGNWVDQRGELDDAQARRGELQVEIDEVAADIERIVGEDGLEIAARCYGPYVEVGEEVYALPGLDGCVTQRTP
jgi:hypothetical protein